MRVLLTGVGGGLGTSLTRKMQTGSSVPVGFDVLPRPTHWVGEYVQGSIIDRASLEHAMAKNIEAVVHIAAYHGVHEHPVLEGQPSRDAYEFWDLNVNGTFNVFEAAARAGVKAVVYISSTSIPREKHGLYGHTKVLGEQIASTYAHRHNMRVITLRPRGFVPHTDRTVYGSYLDYVKYFWKGAVHVDDVAQCVERALSRLAAPDWSFVEPPVCVVDGKFDYSLDDLESWDKEGAGSTFKKTYGEDNYNLALSHGLDPSRAPRVVAKLPEHTHSAAELLGYTPQYSIRNLLEELRSYGASGPPAQLLDQSERGCKRSRPEE